mmetsp:Transcript_4818/g.19266  ORF Transcript_4818/g.19266 Transcript_4818/m.19266 type:complete len:295 (-) Transcript_4818:142-1026(-)
MQGAGGQDQAQGGDSPQPQRAGLRGVRAGGGGDRGGGDGAGARARGGRGAPRGRAHGDHQDGQEDHPHGRPRLQRGGRSARAGPGDVRAGGVRHGAAGPRDGGDEGAQERRRGVRVLDALEGFRRVGALRRAGGGGTVLEAPQRHGGLAVRRGRGRDQGCVRGEARGTQGARRPHGAARCRGAGAPGGGGVAFVDGGANRGARSARRRARAHRRGGARVRARRMQEGHGLARGEAGFAERSGEIRGPRAALGGHRQKGRGAQEVRAAHPCAAQAGAAAAGDGDRARGGARRGSV